MKSRPRPFLGIISAKRVTIKINLKLCLKRGREGVKTGGMEMWPFEETLRNRNKDALQRHREWLRRWMLEWTSRFRKRFK